MAPYSTTATATTNVPRTASTKPESLADITPDQIPDGVIIGSVTVSASTTADDGANQKAAMPALDQNQTPLS